MKAKTPIMKLSIFLLLTACLLNAANLSFASPPDKSKGAGKSPFQNISETSFPKIDNIKFKGPAAGRPCPVQADITDICDNTKANITAVKLIYYLNGDLDRPNELTMSKGPGKRYTASIPAMASGVRVDFIIRAEDSNGNTASQAVPSSKNLVPGIADDDNSSESLPDSLDLLGMSAGYDKNYIYVQCNLRGKISPGAKDPPSVHVYAVKFTNPDIDPKENLYNGKGVFYVPMAIGTEWGAGDQDSYWLKMLGGKEKVLRVKKTGTIFGDIKNALALKGSKAFPDIGYLAKADGNTLSVKIARTAFGKNPSGYLRIIGFTCDNKNLTTIFPLFSNCTNFLILYTSSQSYTVK